MAKPSDNLIEFLKNQITVEKEIVSSRKTVEQNEESRG